MPRKFELSRALPATQSTHASKINIQMNLKQRRKDAKRKGTKKQRRKTAFGSAHESIVTRSQ